MSVAWTKRTYSFDWLKDYARQFKQYTSIFEWLKVIGVIPNDVNSARVTQVRANLDPLSIEGGYLASCAYEWDSWGKSHPIDFMNALEYELVGAPENSLGNYLTGLLHG